MGDYQNGFRDGRSVTDNILALKIINKKPWEYKQSVQYLFIDFHKAYDSTGHAVAQWLRHCAINRKVAGLIPDGVTGIFH
jgi:hypothetical protein